MCATSDSMPKTNHQCLVLELEQVSDLVEDALSELEEVGEILQQLKNAT